MSADNWELCPRCLNEARQGQAILEQRVADEYGKIPIEEWERLRAEASRGLGDLDDEQHSLRTFRENYETYTSDGKLHVHYSGWCTVCRLTHKYDHEERFYMATAP